MSNGKAMIPYLDSLVTQQDWSPYDELKTERGNFGVRQQLFVDHYVANPGSARAAAIASGIQEDGAAVQAHKWMKDDLILAAIAQKMNEKIERTRITADRIIHELAIIAFSSLSDYKVDPITGFVQNEDGVPEYVLRAVSGLKFIVTVDEDGNETRRTELKLWDKVAALQLLGKNIGMFADRLHLSGGVEVRQKWKVGDKEIVF